MKVQVFVMPQHFDWHGATENIDECGCCVFRVKQLLLLPDPENEDIMLLQNVENNLVSSTRHNISITYRYVASHKHVNLVSKKS